MFSLRRYDSSLASVWDGFVAQAKNGLFLFKRDYMDYHADRFTDHSLCVFRDDVLFAVIPACEKEGQLLSHAGLTFGGIISGDGMKTSHMLEIFDILKEYLGTRRFTSFLYKAVPHIYARIPAEEDRYALFRFGARLERCDVTCTIDRAHRLPYSDRRGRGIKKALKHPMQFVRSENYADYFGLVAGLLDEKYQARPTHTADEMVLLAGRFSENIHLWVARRVDGKMLAGVIMYLHARVAHAQYIAAGAEGKECGALDGLFDHLITQAYPHHAWFDFGISTEEGGRQLNTGLITQKEEFGGRAVVHETFRWDIG